VQQINPQKVPDPFSEVLGIETLLGVSIPAVEGNVLDCFHWVPFLLVALRSDSDRLLGTIGKQAYF